LICNRWGAGSGRIGRFAHVCPKTDASGCNAHCEKHERKPKLAERKVGVNAKRRDTDD